MNHPNWKQFDNLTRKLYISAHEATLPTLLRNYDRYSMANSVEIRMPFMDYRIMVFAFSLPWNSKICNGFSKAIIRDAMSGIMPKEVAYRKSKIGFNSPVVDWMKHDLRDFFLDMIHSESFKTCRLINPEQTALNIRKVIDDPYATFRDGEQAWKQISPYLWEQAVIKKAGEKPHAETCPLKEISEMSSYLNNGVFYHESVHEIQY